MFCNDLKPGKNLRITFESYFMTIVITNNIKYKNIKHNIQHL